MVKANRQRSAYADRLQAALREAKKTDNELAAHLGVSIQAVRKLWRGDSQALTAGNNPKAAALVGHCSDYLAVGSGPRRTGQSAATEDVQRKATLSERAASIAERLDALSPDRRMRAYALMDLTLSTVEAEEDARKGSADAKRRSRKA